MYLMAGIVTAACFLSNNSHVLIVVAILSGGWKRGDRAFYRIVRAYLVERGLAAFSAIYRLADPVVYACPAAGHDLNVAVQHLLSRACDLNVDPDRIMLTGGSAGAHPGVLAGFAGDLASLGRDPKTRFPTQARTASRPSGSKAFTFFSLRTCNREYVVDRVRGGCAYQLHRYSRFGRPSVVWKCLI